MSQLPHLLTYLIFFPAIAAMGLVLFPRMDEEAAKQWALVAMIVELFLGIWLVLSFSPGRAFAMVEQAPWIPSWGISYSVGVDGISLFLVFLATLLVPIGLLASWNQLAKKPRAFCFWLLLLETGLIGALLATDLFLFYVFWELMLLPMFFLMGIWGGPRRLRATLRFVIYTMLGSLLMFLSILVLAYTFQQRTGHWSFALSDLSAVHPAGTLGVVLFLGFAIAFAIKVPLVPFHTWLPDAYVEAPTAGTFLLSAVMAKLGVYGFIRYAFPMFPRAALGGPGFAFSGGLSALVMILGMLGVIYAGWIAVGQRDLKRLIAYSSASHLGMIMVGIGAWNLLSVTGGVYQMLNHAVATGALFLIIGLLYERVGVRAIDELGGLAKDLPWLSAAFMLAMLASVGLPGLNGFIGEFLILIGAFGANRLIAVLAATGVIIAAIYLLWMYGRSFFGSQRKWALTPLPDLNRREFWLLLPLMVLMVLMGVYPQPFLDRIEPSVQAYVAGASAPPSMPLPLTRPPLSAAPRSRASGRSAGLPPSWGSPHHSFRIAHE